MKGKKTGGRKAGTPNERSREAKECIAKILSTYHTAKDGDYSLLQKDFLSLDQKDRIDAYIKMCKLIIPPPQEEGDATRKLSVNERLQLLIKVPGVDD